MANRPNDPNPPAQLRHPGDRFRENRGTNPELFRGVGDDYDEAMDDEGFDQPDDLENESDEGEGRF